MILFQFRGANPPVVSEPLPGNPASIGRGQERDCIGDSRRRNAPMTEFRRPNASQRIVIACHKVPIQALSLFVSITTTSRSLVPSATVAMP